MFTSSRPSHCLQYTSLPVNKSGFALYVGSDKHVIFKILGGVVEIVNDYYLSLLTQPFDLKGLSYLSLSV